MAGPDRTARMSRRVAGLPVHPVPAGVADGRSLVVHGLVSRARVFEPAEIATMPHREVEADFSCEEGWTVPAVRWHGVSLKSLIDLAQPLAEARYVRVVAGPYQVALPLGGLDGVLMCDGLDGQPLPRRHGGPWRLLVRGGECFTSVKWVERLEVAVDAGEPTGKATALGRLAPMGG